MSFTFELVVGRLCEFRFGEDFTAADMPMVRSRMARLFSDNPGKLLFCTDIRRPKRFGPEEERQLAEFMRTDSARIGRSAFLVARGSSLALQVLRLVSDSEHKARRVFQDRRELEGWLSEGMTNEEKARLDQFLDG
jgi:hypothetical protein